MRIINALSVANYFVDIAQKEGKDLTPLGLIKRVYAAHGFSLAILNKSLLDERFDRVEAWCYGPVIPSVYYSFKFYEANPITKKTVMMEWDQEKGEPLFVTPELDDEKAKIIVEMVWKRYRKFNDREMVELMHKKGTPWYWRYVKNENQLIPDNYTKLYYEKLVNKIMKNYFLSNSIGK